MSTEFFVLTNKVNNLSADDANKVIDYMKKIIDNMVDKARSICGEFEEVSIDKLYSAEKIYIKIVCGNYVDEKKILVSDILRIDNNESNIEF
jgi:hypothetical protein